MDNRKLIEELFLSDKELASLLLGNPPHTALAYTVEDFCIPANVSGGVCDKSSYARVFVSAFNTFFDPGFEGNATLELVNLGDAPVTYQRGDPVCQMIFHWLDEPTEEPYNGKYMHQTKQAHAARFENVIRRGEYDEAPLIGDTRHKAAHLADLPLKRMRPDGTEF